jgi:hypothetical protein
MSDALSDAILLDTRIQLHWALQAASAVGRTLLPRQPDDSHQSFQWNGNGRQLEQGLVQGRHPFRSALRFHDLSLLLLDQQGAIEEEMPLTGRTLSDAYSTLERRCSELSGEAVILERNADGPPPHAVASGAPFQPDPGALALLSKLYGDAAELLNEVHATEEHSSEVRCWPHHFDIATLIVVRPAIDDAEARTVGAGFVGGDASYKHPYWYVTPWPYPTDRNVPPLSSGEWHRDHWFGAVLPARDRTPAQLRQFLGEAISRSRELVAV